MSAEKTPVLCGSIPAFELFMSKWEKLAADNKHLKRLIRPGLKVAYKYYSRMDCTSAYIITMRKRFCLPAPENWAN